MQKAAADSSSRCTLLLIVPRLVSFTGGEDQSYIDNPWVAGSNPAGPKGNRSSTGRAAEETLIAGSPVDVFRSPIGIQLPVVKASVTSLTNEKGLKAHNRSRWFPGKAGTRRYRGHEL